MLQVDVEYRGNPDQTNHPSLEVVQREEQLIFEPDYDHKVEARIEVIVYESTELPPANFLG